MGPWPTHPYRQCKHGTYRFVEMFWPPISKTSVAIRQFPGRMRLWTLIHGVSKLLLVWWVYASHQYSQRFSLHITVHSCHWLPPLCRSSHNTPFYPVFVRQAPYPCLFVLRNAIFLFICTFLISISNNYSPSWFSC